MVAQPVLERDQGRDRESKAITVEDWALVQQGARRQAHDHQRQGQGPGRGPRRACVGGGAGLRSSPPCRARSALGAVAGGAAIGAVTAAVQRQRLQERRHRGPCPEVHGRRPDRDHGRDRRSRRRTRWDAFVAEHAEFEASDRQHHVDIVPGRDFEQALDEYRRTEAERPRLTPCGATSTPGKRRVDRPWRAADGRRGCTSTPAQRTGDEAEALVASRLAAAGWTILARNLRLGRDELDLRRRSTRAAARRSSSSRCGGAAGATSASRRRRWTTASAPPCGVPIGHAARARRAARRHGRCRRSRCASTSSRSTSPRTDGRRSATTGRHPAADDAADARRARPARARPCATLPAAADRRGRGIIHARAGTVPARSPHADQHPDGTVPTDRPGAPARGPRRGSAEAPTAGGHRSAHRLDAPAA